MNAKKTTTAPKLDVKSSGKPLEHGVAIGSALHSRISLAQESIAEYDTFRAYCPWWMPFSVYRMLAERHARQLLEPGVAAAFPEMAERIRGIAEGAKTSINFLYLFHAMESVSAPREAVTQPALAGCTAVAATGSRTPSGHAVVAHNFDLVDLVEPLLSARETQGDRYRYLGFSLAPMAGVIDGVNEAGLAITYDYAPTVDVKSERPPISLAIENALANCSTVNEAADRITRLPHGGGALIMLADTHGDIASLELSADHSSLRRPDDDDVVHHSNAYRTATMQKIELPHDSVYNDQAPPALRNVRIRESAEIRDSRIESLLRDIGMIDELTLTELMSDHGPNGEPSPNTVCMHEGYWSTLASVQLYPKERRMRLGYGSACQASFVDFQL